MTETPTPIQTGRPPGDHRFDVLITLATNLVLAVLGFTTSALQARLLGPSSRGELQAIQLLPNIIASVAMLGVQDAVIYFGASQPGHVGRYARSALILIVTAALPITLIGWNLLPLTLPNYDTGVVRMSQWWLVATLFSCAVGGVPHQVARAVQRPVLWNLLRLASATWWVILLLGSHAGLGGPPTPTRIAAIYLSGVAILSVVNWFPVLSYFHGPVSVEATLWRPLLRYGLPNMLAVLPQLAAQRLDQIVVAVRLPAHELGLYAVALAWSGSVSLASSAIAAVAFPRIAGLANARDQKRLLMRGVLVTLVVSTSAAVGLGVMSDWLIPIIFGRQFEDASTLSRILLLSAPIRSLVDVLESGARGTGQTRLVLGGESMAVAVGVAAAVFFVPLYGALGAAMAIGFGGLSALLIVAIGTYAWSRRSAATTPSPSASSAFSSAVFRTRASSSRALTSRPASSV